MDSLQAITRLTDQDHTPIQEDGVAQLVVERRTKKKQNKKTNKQKQTKQKQTGAKKEGFFSQESTVSADSLTVRKRFSYGVRTVSVRNWMHQYLCAR